MTADGIKIKGSLDRLEFLNDGGTKTKDPFRVIDYKTGRPKTRNEIEGKKNKQWQLQTPTHFL